MLGGTSFERKKVGKFGKLERRIELLGMCSERSRFIKIIYLMVSRMEGPERGANKTCPFFESKVFEIFIKNDRLFDFVYMKAAEIIC